MQNVVACIAVRLFGHRDALEEASGQPVRSMMNSWTRHPGIFLCMRCRYMCRYMFPASLVFHCPILTLHLTLTLSSCTCTCPRAATPSILEQQGARCASVCMCITHNIVLNHVGVQATLCIWMWRFANGPIILPISRCAPGYELDSALEL